MSNGKQEDVRECINQIDGVFGLKAANPVQRPNPKVVLPTDSPAQASSSNDSNPQNSSFISSIFKEIIPNLKDAASLIPLIFELFSKVWISDETSKPFCDADISTHQKLKSLFSRMIKQETPEYWALDENHKPVWKMTFGVMQRAFEEYLRGVPEEYKIMQNIARQQLEALIQLVDELSTNQSTGFKNKITQFFVSDDSYRSNGIEMMIFAEIAIWLSIGLPVSNITNSATLEMLKSRKQYFDVLLSEKIVSTKSNFESIKRFFDQLSYQLEELIKLVDYESGKVPLYDNVQHLKAEIISGILKNQFQWLYQLLEGSENSHFSVFGALNYRSLDVDNYIYKNLLGRWIKNALYGLGIKGESFEIHSFIDFATIDNLFENDLKDPKDLKNIGLLSCLFETDEQAHLYMTSIRNIFKLTYELALVLQNFSFLEEIIYENGEDWFRKDRYGQELLKLFIDVVEHAQHKLIKEVDLLQAHFSHKVARDNVALKKAQGIVQEIKTAEKEIKLSLSGLRDSLKRSSADDSVIDEMLQELFEQLIIYAKNNNLDTPKPLICFSSFSKKPIKSQPHQVIDDEKAGPDEEKESAKEIKKPADGSLNEQEDIQKKSLLLQHQSKELANLDEFQEIVVERKQREKIEDSKHLVKLASIPYFSLFKDFLFCSERVPRDLFNKIDSYTNGKVFYTDKLFPSEIMKQVFQDIVMGYRSYYLSSNFFLWLVVKTGKIDEFRKMYEKLNAIFSFIQHEELKGTDDNRYVDMKLVDLLLVRYAMIFFKDIVEDKLFDFYALYLINAPSITHYGQDEVEVQFNVNTAS